MDVSTEFLQLLEACGNENGITMHNLYRIAKLHLNEHETPENVKCTVKCVLYNKGFVDQHGRLQVDNILAQIPDPETKHFLFVLLHSCSNVDGDNPCQRAFNTYKCLDP